LWLLQEQGCRDTDRRNTCRLLASGQAFREQCYRIILQSSESFNPSTSTAHRLAQLQGRLPPSESGVERSSLARVFRLARWSGPSSRRAHQQMKPSVTVLGIVVYLTGASAGSRTRIEIAWVRRFSCCYFRGLTRGGSSDLQPWGYIPQPSSLNRLPLGTGQRLSNPSRWLNIALASLARADEARARSRISASLPQVSWQGWI
jgi:hypothetical protein